MQEQVPATQGIAALVEWELVTFVCGVVQNSPKGVKKCFKSHL